MPRTFGKCARVRDADVVIDEIMGPCSTRDDNMSVCVSLARQPWVSEWIVYHTEGFVNVRRGKIAFQYVQPDTNNNNDNETPKNKSTEIEIVVAKVGESCYIPCGCCLRWDFLEPNTEFLEVNIPAFSPADLDFLKEPHDSGDPPRLIGEVTRVQLGEAFLDELVGPHSTRTDRFSLHVFSEHSDSLCKDWFCAGHLNQWTCVFQGQARIHSGDEEEVKTIDPREVCFTSKDELQFVQLSEPNTELVILMVPPFRPDSHCLRL